MDTWEDRNTYDGYMRYSAPETIMAERIIDRISAREEVDALLRSVGFEDPAPYHTGRKPRPTYA